MTPLSEADTEIKAAVVAILGECACLDAYRRAWRCEATDRYDPHCAFHQYGEDVADLARDNRRLRKSLATASVYNQLRKAPK